MRRRKRVAIFRIAVAVGLVAVIAPTATQAKPLPASPDNEQGMPVYVIGSPDDRKHERTAGASSEQQVIPYLSQGRGVTSDELRVIGSPDDRRFERTAGASTEQRVIPYLSQGNGVTSDDLGFVTGKTSDDRTYSRAPALEAVPATSDDGWSIDVNPFAVTGFALALMLAIGMALAVRHSRRARPLSA